MDFEGKKFYFCRNDGAIFADNLVLRNDHVIQGAKNSNESRWTIDNNHLVFLNSQNQPTTRFHIKIDLKGRLIFLGKFLYQPEYEIRHLLLEKHVLEEFNLQAHLDDLARKLNPHFDQLSQNVYSISRQVARMERSRHKIKVLFLIHNIASWDSLGDVYEEMRKDDQLEVIVATTARSFPGETLFTHEDENHNFFEEKGIPHIRLPSTSPNNLQILKYINPDAIFRQAPWDQDIPKEYSVDSLAFTNLFYIPYYGFNIIESVSGKPDEINFHANTEFHKCCAQVYFENEMIKDMMAKKSDRGGDNFIATGHPKLERLANARHRQSYWPISRTRKQKITKIIWAPHHTYTNDEYTSFGLFKETYKDMLEWVKNDKNIDVVLKPHPALFSSLLGRNLISPQEFQSFIDEWSALPNATIVEGGDYGPLMVGSDIMLTEGVSFLAEYMLFWEKPLIFLRNKKHAKFNIVGEMIEKAAYVVDDVNGIKKLLRKISSSKNDSKKMLRKKVFKELMPFENGAAKRVVSHFKKYFIN